MPSVPRACLNFQARCGVRACLACPLKGGTRFRHALSLPCAPTYIPTPGTLGIENLAAFEASKRRKRHPAALRADVRRGQKRVEATSKARRAAEDAGQMALAFDEGTK